MREEEGGGEWMEEEDGFEWRWRTDESKRERLGRRFKVREDPSSCLLIGILASWVAGPMSRPYWGDITWLPSTRVCWLSVRRTVLASTFRFLLIHQVRPISRLTRVRSHQLKTPHSVRRWKRKRELSRPGLVKFVDVNTGPGDRLLPFNRTRMIILILHPYVLHPPNLLLHIQADCYMQANNKTIKRPASQETVYRVLYTTHTHQDRPRKENRTGWENSQPAYLTFLPEPSFKTSPTFPLLSRESVMLNLTVRSLTNKVRRMTRSFDSAAC